MITHDRTYIYIYTVYVNFGIYSLSHMYLFRIKIIFTIKYHYFIRDEILLTCVGKDKKVKSEKNSISLVPFGSLFFLILSLGSSVLEKESNCIEKRNLYYVRKYTCSLISHKYDLFHTLSCKMHMFYAAYNKLFECVHIHLNWMFHWDDWLPWNFFFSVRRSVYVVISSPSPPSFPFLIER